MKPAWRRNLAVMVVIQFVMGVAFSMMMPFLPLFVAELGVPGGHVEIWSGLVFSINFLTAALMTPVWGYLADRTGNKPMVVRSAAAVAIFTALMGLSPNVWVLFVLRGLMGAFSGFSAAATALIGAQVPRDRMGFALGTVQTGMVIGAVLGPLIGGILADSLGSYRYVFYATGLAAFIATLLAWFLVQEAKVEHTGPRPSLWASVGGIASNRALLPMYVVLIMDQVGLMAIAPVLALFVADLVGPDHANLALLAGAAQAATGVANAISSPLIGARADRVGHKRILLFSLLGAGILLFPQGLVGSFLALVILRFVLGFAMGGLRPASYALVGALAPPEQRGQAFGVASSATFIGNFIGPLLGGFISGAFGIPVMFMITGVLLVSSGIWLAFAVQEPTAKEEART